jgi:alpha-N-acetylglucosamine transferase
VFSIIYASTLILSFLLVHVIMKFFCREWQSDRVKLIHCIHLQQLELTQRAVASHEKATDIAKVTITFCELMSQGLESYYFKFCCHITGVCSRD